MRSLRYHVYGHLQEKVVDLEREKMRLSKKAEAMEKEMRSVEERLVLAQKEQREMQADLGQGRRFRGGVRDEMEGEGV